MTISSSGCWVMMLAFEQPNAERQAPPEAAATQEQRL